MKVGKLLLKDLKERKRDRKRQREKGRKRKRCARPLHRKLQNVIKFHKLENLLL